MNPEDVETQEDLTEYIEELIEEHERRENAENN